MPGALHNLLEGRTDVWRGRESISVLSDRLFTGHADLDDSLGCGWPRRAVVELVTSRGGGGGLELILPALANLSRQHRWIALVDPPFTPFAPGFAGWGVRTERLLWLRPANGPESLWALEQALRGGACSAVLGWWREDMKRDQVRRLQLAAEKGDAVAFIFLSSKAGGIASAAALRLRVRRPRVGIQVDILKRRGGSAQETRVVSDACPSSA